MLNLVVSCRPTPGNSGINLDPGDSGISLEDGGSDEIVFEDETPRGKPAARTPAPKKGGKAKPPVEEDKDSSSEFELSTDDPSSEKDSSSEFELSMDEESSPGVDSSSEFELSLEDDDSAKGKVLLHCTVGWRASHMWAAYLVKDKKMSYADAVKAGEAINLNGYKPANAKSTPLEDLLGMTPKAN